MKNLFYFILFVFMLLMFYGCSGIKNSAGDISEQLVKPLKENADTVGFRLVQGMRESLTGAEAKEQLKELIDSLTSNLGNNLNTQLTGIRDSLLGAYLVNWLQRDLLGDKTAERLVYIRNSVLDSYLKDYLREITSRLGSDVLNDSVLSRLGAARETLIGKRSNEMIKSIVDSAMFSIVNRLNKDINPLLKENLDFVQKNATWLLILIGVIAVVIILVVWNRKEKYLKISQMLTYQISELPDKTIKESLKTSISQNAKTIGLEGELRDMLNRYGLLHSE